MVSNHFHSRIMVVNTLFCRVPGSARILKKKTAHTLKRKRVLQNRNNPPWTIFRAYVCARVCMMCMLLHGIHLSKPIIPIIIPNPKWSPMSSDFDDDIDFDPDDLTILLHFFRKLWYRLPGVPEGILQTTTATVTTISAISLLSIRPSVALVLHHLSHHQFFFHHCYNKVQHNKTTVHQQPFLCTTPSITTFL